MERNTHTHTRTHAQLDASKGMASRIKANIRCLTRLIAKRKDTMSASDLAEKEASLVSLQQQLTDFQSANAAPKVPVRAKQKQETHDRRQAVSKKKKFYSKIRFFEKKKLLRAQKRLRQTLAQSLQGSEAEQKVSVSLCLLSFHSLPCVFVCVRVYICVCMCVFVCVSMCVHQTNQANSYMVCPCSAVRR